MNEKCIGINYDYNPEEEFIAPDSDSLTASLIAYLRHQGMHVEKAICPCVKYKNIPMEMKSYKIDETLSLQEQFDHLYNHIYEMNPEVVIIYYMKNNYMYVQDIDSNFKKHGQPKLRIRTVLRYGMARVTISEIHHTEIGRK